MPDERTNSTITWFNSALRGNQNSQTLIDMIQVGQWYDQHEVSICLPAACLSPLSAQSSSLLDKNTQNKESNVKQEYRPVVKFRNIEESVLRAVQTRTGDEPSPRNHDLSEDAESDYDSEDDNTDTNIIRPPPAQDFAFEIDEDIDIDSKGLRDMVSVEPVVHEISQSRHVLSKTALPARLPESPNWDW